VRPYLQHASAVVAPLRVARGIQNKILEAMAMQQPVVTVSSCAEAIGATDTLGLLRADDPTAMVQQLDGLLRDAARRTALGESARGFVEQRYSWQAHLRSIDDHLPIDDHPPREAANPAGACHA
jgi:polysaccharide biosynthesis protein PslH